MPGSRLGNGCILGEGTLVPPNAVVPDDAVLVGRPPHVIRSATDADRERLAVLRQHQTNLTDYPGTVLRGSMKAGEHMGTLYAYRGKTPSIGVRTILFDSAEITGDVFIGEDSLIGAGVKIIGDSHGPVRIGSRVQILENTVLHLLPDNELIIDDDAIIGPGEMIHGCHIGRGSVVEPGAIVCDGGTMSTLYTKNGRPLQVSGGSVYSKSGVYVGHISDNKIYNPKGRYAATIDGDRAVYRRIDSAGISSPTTSARHAGIAVANAARSAMYGDEPDFPD